VKRQALAALQEEPGLYNRYLDAQQAAERAARAAA
jgi:hypothetical protein